MVGFNLLCNAAPTSFVLDDERFLSVDSFHEASKFSEDTQCDATPGRPRAASSAHAATTCGVRKWSYRVQSGTMASLWAGKQTERVNRLRAIGSLSGSVVDASSTPAAFATVCLTGTILWCVADERGTFRLPNIRSGLAKTVRRRKRSEPFERPPTFALTRESTGTERSPESRSSCFSGSRTSAMSAAIPGTGARIPPKPMDSSACSRCSVWSGASETATRRLRRP